MNKFLSVAVLGLMLIATSVQAADKGMYVSGNLGLSLLSDSDNEYPSPCVGCDFEVSHDLGFNIGGAIGYDFGNIRAEGEIAYHRNDIDEVKFIGVPAIPVDGSVSALSFMVNGYYDIPIANSPLVPYLGGGIGVANISADAKLNLGFPFGSLEYVDDSAMVFAYQFMVGLGFNINPAMTLTAGYRYFATTSPEFNDSTGISPTNFDSEFQTHEFNVGARFMF